MDNGVVELPVLYVASGGSSSLFHYLYPILVKRYRIYATEHKTPISFSGVKLVEDEDGVPFRFNGADRIFWLSSHTDTEFLKRLVRTNVPILAINSAAVNDFVFGGKPMSEANAYQKAKLELLFIVGIHNFICGFFIQDVGDNEGSKGLHTDSNQRIFSFSKTTTESDFDWSESMVVTPLSGLQSAVFQWLKTPEKFFNAHCYTKVHSKNAYRRDQLKYFAVLLETDILFNDDEIYDSCKKARKVFEK